MYEFRYPRLWLALGWLGITLLVALSLLPVMISLPVSSGDKIGHLLAYTLLMGWFVQLYRDRRTVLLFAAGLVLLGVTLEFLQQLTGRHFELADMLANSLGVMLGLLIGMTPLRGSLLTLESLFIRTD